MPGHTGIHKNLSWAWVDFEFWDLTFYAAMLPAAFPFPSQDWGSHFGWCLPLFCTCTPHLKEPSCCTALHFLLNFQLPGEGDSPAQKSSHREFPRLLFETAPAGEALQGFQVVVCHFTSIITLGTSLQAL